MINNNNKFPKDRKLPFPVSKFLIQQEYCSYHITLKGRYNNTTLDYVHFQFLGKQFEALSNKLSISMNQQAKESPTNSDFRFLIHKKRSPLNSGGHYTNTIRHRQN